MTEPTRRDRRERPADAKPRPFELPAKHSIQNIVGQFFVEQRVAEREEYKGDNYRQAVVESNAAFHALENGSEGSAEGHGALASYLYSRNLMEAVAGVHQFAEATNNEPARQSSLRAMFVLQQAFEIVRTYGIERGLSLADSFSEMQRRQLDGGYGWANFLALMSLARRESVQVIEENRSQITTETAGSEFTGHFHGVAEKAVQEEREALNGLEFGEVFEAELKSDKTKALVLSLDFNSTWNRQESYPNQQLIGRAVAEIERLSEEVARRFPDKELYVVINTGRPALYAWGVLEAIKAHPSLRKLALAESGGAVLTEMQDGRREVAVEDSARWQKNLDALKTYLLNAVRTANVNVEPKLSMLSMQIAQKPDAGGSFVLEDEEGKPVTPEWIEQRVKQFFVDQIDDMRAKLVRYQGELTVAGSAEDGLDELVSQLGNGERAGSQELIDLVEGILDVYEGERRAALQSINQDLRAIREMSKNLLIDFNPTAGFVDIGHKDLNKYSTLRTELSKRGIAPEEVSIVHIGDSGTDVMPIDRTGAGQVNEGADRVWQVAVGNSNKRMMDATDARTAKNGRGIKATRDSSLALIDMLKGVRRSVVQAAGNGSFDGK